MCYNHFISPDTYAKSLFGFFKITHFFLINIVDLSLRFLRYPYSCCCDLLIRITAHLLPDYWWRQPRNLIIQETRSNRAISLVQRNPTLVSLGLSSPDPFFLKEFSKRGLQLNRQNSKTVGFSFNHFIYPAPLTKCFCDLQSNFYTLQISSTVLINAYFVIYLFIYLFIY